MLDALYRVGLDRGFLVAGKIDIGEDEQRLRAIGDVKSAVEAHRLDAIRERSDRAEASAAPFQHQPAESLPRTR